MKVLAFDISSGGVSAAIFDSELRVLRVIERHWELATDEAGAATLTVDNVFHRMKEVSTRLNMSEPVDAIVIGCFMHNCVLLDQDDRPLTPVFTWLDRRGENGMEYIRSRLGDRFHERTGCRFHPMFPVFKIATLHLREHDVMTRVRRVVSLKSLLVQRLTGVWIEDYGMASSSGMLNIDTGDWDPGLIGLLGLRSDNLPPVADRSEAVGLVTRQAAEEFGLPAGAMVVNGSGDGFLAHLGSNCGTPDRITVTLGTSASARQTLPRPILDVLAGTWCYRSDSSSYLLGCASSNGGNVLNWGRSLFGPFPEQPVASAPIFMPFLNGERSPEWNSRLTGSWHGLTARHSATDLAWSVLEGVLFNLAHYVEILESTSGEAPAEIVLSGNGFLQGGAAQTFAAVVRVRVSCPVDPGMATLRGAAVCALQALGAGAPPLATNPVKPTAEASITDRFERYKKLRRELTLRIEN
ncbi:MAG: hypothetical protein HY646_13030 [Acidobacteria bacterium]|nr:hypothetical protein [Acidobacteriota bacterium]